MTVLISTAQEITHIEQVVENPENSTACFSFLNLDYFVKNWYLTNVMNSSDIMNKSLAKGNSSICLIQKTHL